MGTATIDRDIQLVVTTKKRPSRFVEWAASASRVTLYVEHRWADLSAPTQQLLIDFANKTLDRVDMPKGLRGFLRRLQFSMVLFWFALRGEHEELINFGAKIKRLINAILSQVERSNPHYQTDMKQAIDSALADLASGGTRRMTLEEAQNEHRALSDRILKEL